MLGSHHPFCQFLKHDRGICHCAPDGAGVPAAGAASHGGHRHLHGGRLRGHGEQGGEGRRLARRCDFCLNIAGCKKSTWDDGALRGDVGADLGGDLEAW